MRYFFVVIILIGLLGCVEKSKTTYDETAKEIFLTVWEKYRVPEYGLFSEYYPQNHKPEMFYFQDSAKKAQEVAFLWPMSGVFSSVNILMELDPDFYSPFLDSMIFAVERYFDDQRIPPGYQAYPVDLNHSDRYYDDNGLVGIDYVDAYRVTNNSHYLKKGEEVMNFIKSGWSEDHGGGVSWLEGVRDQKPACSNGKATILALKLYEETSNPEYLNYGLASYNWMINKLKDDSLNIIWNSLLIAEGTGETVQKHSYTYNTGMVIQSAVRLYKITGKDKFLEEAQTLAKGSHDYYVKKLPDSGVTYIEDLPWFIIVLFRGYYELYEIDKNPKYIQSIMSGAVHALNNSRDIDGLFHNDWTGRNIKEGEPKWLLDEACMVEIFGRMAILEKKYNITLEL